MMKDDTPPGLPPKLKVVKTSPTRRGEKWSIGTWFWVILLTAFLFAPLVWLWRWAFGLL
jgi:hypothetical protein